MSQTANRIDGADLPSPSDRLSIVAILSSAGAKATIMGEPGRKRAISSSRFRSQIRTSGSAPMTPPTEFVRRPRLSEAT